MGRLDAAVQNVLDDTELALVSDITVSRILFTRLGRGAMKVSHLRCSSYAAKVDCSRTSTNFRLLPDPLLLYL